MSEAQPEPAEATPSLSSPDLFRLQAATFLSVTQALSQAGVISLPEMAGLLETHIDEHDREPWTDIVLAFAAALRRETAEEAAPTRSRPRLQVIEGGRAS